MVHAGEHGSQAVQVRLCKGVKAIHPGRAGGEGLRGAGARPSTALQC